MGFMLAFPMELAGLWVQRSISSRMSLWFELKFHQEISSCACGNWRRLPVSLSRYRRQPRAVAEPDPDLAIPAPLGAPAPKPVSKKAPAKLLRQKINFSCHALFDFDKAALRAEGRAMIDELVRI